MGAGMKLTEEEEKKIQDEMKRREEERRKYAVEVEMRDRIFRKERQMPGMKFA